MSLNSWKEFAEIIEMEDGGYTKEEVGGEKTDLTSTKSCNLRYFICFYQLALLMKCWDMSAL